MSLERLIEQLEKKKKMVEKLPDILSLLHRLNNRGFDGMGEIKEYTSVGYSFTFAKKTVLRIHLHWSKKVQKWFWYVRVVSLLQDEEFELERHFCDTEELESTIDKALQLWV